VLAQLSSDVTTFASVNHGNAAPSLEVTGNIGGGGAPTGNTQWSIDGAPSMWGTNPAYAPPAEMVAEFKVETAKFDASTAQGAGPTINTALRSGTNQLHGTMSEYFTNNMLLSLSLFQRKTLYANGTPTEAQERLVNPKNHFNRWTGTASGPVKLPGLYNGSNRTFWIYGYDGHHKSSSGALFASTFYATVPTVPERQGDFSALLAAGSRYQIYDPATGVGSSGLVNRQPFANNVMPASRIDAMARKLMPNWPQPNLAGTADGTNSYYLRVPDISKYNAHMGRLDHNLSEKHRIFVRGNWFHQLYDGTNLFNNDATGELRDRYSTGAGFDDVYMFSPTFLMNVRYSLSRFIQVQNPYAKGFDLVGAGFPASLVAQIDPAGIRFPTISPSGYTSLGTSTGGSAASNASQLYQAWLVHFTKVQGNHSLRFGGEQRVNRSWNASFANATPSETFGTSWTVGPTSSAAASPIGQGMAAYLLGLPTAGTIQANGSYAQQTLYSGLFIQDSFKIGTRLVIDAGLRYEYEAPMTERFNRSIAGFDFTAASPIQTAAAAAYAASPIPELPAAQFKALGGLLFAGVGSNSRSLWNPDRKNFGPRLAAAYRLPGNTVVRGGYGIYYLGAGVDHYSVNQQGFTQATSLVASPDGGLTFTASISNPFPAGFAKPAGASGGSRPVSATRSPSSCRTGPTATSTAGARRFSVRLARP
jgi:hypothetical protein